MDARTHRVEVPDVGSFVFRKRTLALQLKIEAAAERLLDGPVQSDELKRYAITVATLQALTADAPGDWALDDIDPLDEEAWGRVLAVFGSLRVAEETFRLGAKAQRAPLGQAA